jgi:hypothetical protein
LTSLQACQSFRRLVSPTSGILGIKKSAPQVHTLSKVIGSPIQCIDIPTEVAAERMKASGIPEILIQGLVDRWIRTRNGESTFYANEVERLTGSRRKPLRPSATSIDPLCHPIRRSLFALFEIDLRFRVDPDVVLV